MNSLPRRAWTMGAFSFSATRSSSAWEPSHPAPPKMVTLVAAFNIAAARSSKVASGVLIGCMESSVSLMRRKVASWRAVSPEITMTLTPRFAIAVLNRYFENPGHLARMRNELTVVTAIFANVIGFGLLEVVAADFLAGNLCGNGQHRYAIAMAIVQAIDEVRVPWSAAAGTHREIAS